MANQMEKLQKSYFENLSQDLCSTCEGAQFMVKYMTSRTAISDLEKKVLEVIKDSDLSVAEAVGFMQYMKHVIPRSSYLPKEK